MALQFFVKSLPLDSKFAILGFGSNSRFEYKKTGKFWGESEIWEYNDENQTEILERINYFDSDFGGTEILEPLKLCVKLKASMFSTRQRRVFLLTDGEVDNKDQIFEYVRNHNEEMRIHTFGIGSGCDKELIKQTAVAGRGSFSFASDGSTDLSGQIISALKKASQPSLKECKFQFGATEIPVYEVFRN